MIKIKLRCGTKFAECLPKGMTSPSFIETLHHIAEPTDEEIDEIYRQQDALWAEERARIERELRGWLERGGEPLQ